MTYRMRAKAPARSPEMILTSVECLAGVSKPITKGRSDLFGQSGFLLALPILGSIRETSRSNSNTCANCHGESQHAGAIGTTLFENWAEAQTNTQKSD